MITWGSIEWLSFFLGLPKKWTNLETEYLYCELYWMHIFYYFRIFKRSRSFIFWCEVSDNVHPGFHHSKDNNETNCRCDCNSVTLKLVIILNWIIYNTIVTTNLSNYCIKIIKIKNWTDLFYGDGVHDPKKVKNLRRRQTNRCFSLN